MLFETYLGVPNHRKVKFCPQPRLSLSVLTALPHPISFACPDYQHSIVVGAGVRSSAATLPVKMEILQCADQKLCLLSLQTSSYRGLQKLILYVCTDQFVCNKKLFQITVLVSNCDHECYFFNRCC